MSASTPELPPRIVHLSGGLRAIDDRSGSCAIQITAERQLVRFPAPEYAKLYLDLSRRNLPALGAEFVNADSYVGRSAPDWQCSSPAGGFQLMAERGAWANIRYAALEDGNTGAADVASRAKTYLDLLSIRLFQLSDAYNRTLREWDDGKRQPGLFFSNSHMRYIDAAVHAFVSDAGACRDLSAEIVWRFVLHGTDPVTTLASFLKKAKEDPNPLAAKIVAAGKTGGWLKILTDLRNDVVHVAPVGRSQTFHFCQAREITLTEKISVPSLHYAILGEGGVIRKDDGDEINWRDESTVKAALEKYRTFFTKSIDALEYAWRTIDNLVDLLKETRVATNLRGEMPHITDDDIVGEVRLT